MFKKYTARAKVSEDLVEQLLYNRGVKTKREREIFLNPDFEKHTYDPFLLPDMEIAVSRIIKAIEDDERIAVWSDYDADGIPGGALLHDFFKMIGFNNFINYIPDRHIEGYGLNIEGIEGLKGEGVKLIVTVDCGIRDHKFVDAAKDLGIDVIITDHHEPSGEIPSAYAVVNPKRNDSEYPEKILCGTGVVWKLVQATLKILRNDKTPRLRLGRIRDLKLGFEKWLLDLVGIATLSDMVPLVGENRVLSYFGLKVLRKGRRLGLSKLFSMLQVRKDKVAEDDVVFLITPRINAASRMGHPLDAFNLLVSDNEDDATKYARHLDHINNERKGAVASLVKDAKKKVRERIVNLGDKPIIVLGHPDWKPSLLGLVANSLAEEFGKPAFVWGAAYEEGVLKGSCRSDGVTDLVMLMERTKEYFLEFGGHKFSGGFSIAYEKIHTLEIALADAYIYAPQDDGGEILADAELRISEVNEDTYLKVEKLAPYGTGNEKPLFILRDVIPQSIKRFGKNQEHLLVTLQDGSHTAKAISFFTAPDKFGDSLKEGMATNLVANIEKSYWNGSSEIRLRIVDFF